MHMPETSAGRCHWGKNLLQTSLVAPRISKGLEARWRPHAVTFTAVYKSGPRLDQPPAAELAQDTGLLLLIAGCRPPNTQCSSCCPGNSSNSRTAARDGAAGSLWSGQVHLLGEQRSQAWKVGSRVTQAPLIPRNSKTQRRVVSWPQRQICVHLLCVVLGSSFENCKNVVKRICPSSIC